MGRVLWLCLLLTLPVRAARGAEAAAPPSPERRVIEAAGCVGHPGDNGLFEIPEGQEAIVEEYSSSPPPGKVIPKRWTSAFWFERKNHVLLKADPTGEAGTVLAPGHYRLIADGGVGAKARLVYRLGPRVHVVTQPRLDPAPNFRDELGYRAPAVWSFTIVPMGSGPFPETVGLVETLARRFPGLSFKVAPVVALPEKVINEHGEVRPEVLASLLTPRAGYLALIDRSIPHSVTWGEFPYGYLDSATGSGVASVFRYRQWAAGSDASRAHAWTHNLVTATVGMMLGLSWPCRREVCALRPARGPEEHDQVRGDLCERHQKELQEVLRK